METLKKKEEVAIEPQQPKAGKRVVETIIILALPKHDDAFTSTPYQLAAEFAKERTVWYISHPYTWIDFLKQRKDPKAWKRFKATLPGAIISEKIVPSNVHLLYLPLTIPINGLPPGLLYDLLSWANHKLVASAIKRMIRKEKIKNYTFINSHDFYFGRIHRLLPKPFQYIYHCIDPIIKAYSARHGHYLEKEAAEEADMVIATSPFLQKKMQQYHTESHCVPNAANFQLSHQASLPETEVHPDIQKIPAPRIGYIGNIERRIDYAWLTEIFTRHPAWQLVMVGPHDKQFIPDAFLKLGNLHLLPPVPHQQLPTVLKGFEVAMIPFKKDEVSAQIYPLKLFEYMGSGKPVVTTDFNEEVIGPFRKNVYVGTTEKEFEGALEKALTEKDTLLADERMLIASANDWAARGKKFLEYIDTHTYAQRT